MKNKSLLTVVALFSLCSTVFAQNNLPVIKATSDLADIRDGSSFVKGNWRISPQVNPDVYTTSNEEVIFYTNIDSIRFKVVPGEVYDFIVLLNEKDSAYTQIRYQPSRLDILKKAKDYDDSDMRFVPEFTYQAMIDSNLVRIRETFNLDSIAGQGNDVSKIINLLYWVHGVVRHDGGSSNPVKKNAIDLINICRSEGRGVNCRMMATLLNECYLAIGIKSRFVTCMPRETEFDDCHVINMVYSDELQKWVWADPTFCAYVMDEEGELLGLSEVRERLVDGRTLILNPDANWNKQSSQTKAYYLETYMAKNLYRMECALDSKYDTETFKKGMESVYVELLPLDGIEQTPQKSGNTTADRTWTHYKTNNPAVFWAKPE